MLIAVLINTTLLLTACRTSKINTLDIPAIDFPQFPIPNEKTVVFDEESGKVIMALDYFERIYEYKVRVDEAHSVYERIREAVNGKAN